MSKFNNADINRKRCWSRQKNTRTHVTNQVFLWIGDFNVRSIKKIDKFPRVEIQFRWKFRARLVSSIRLEESGVATWLDGSQKVDINHVGCQCCCFVTGESKTREGERQSYGRDRVSSSTSHELIKPGRNHCRGSFIKLPPDVCS